MAEKAEKSESRADEIGLHNLSPKPGSRRPRKRVGRGPGSGTGKTSGRGHGGQGQRSGNQRKVNLEGGQNPIHMRMRKLRGPHMKKSMPFEPFRTHTQAVNLQDLEARFDSGAEVTLEALAAENLGKRKGETKNMISSNGNTRLEFFVPARGLIGFRNEFMTQTKGTGILHHNFHGYEPFKGELSHRTRGSLVALETGEAVAYGMFKLQERSTFFIEPQTKVYAGMIVGENTREGDMTVNVCKSKALTNMRASGSDEAVRLEPARIMTLEQAIEWIGDDEYVEVTPNFIRLRKKWLDHNERNRMSKKKNAVEE